MAPAPPVVATQRASSGETASQITREERRRVRWMASAFCEARAPPGCRRPPSASRAPTRQPAHASASSSVSIMTRLVARTRLGLTIPGQHRKVRVPAANATTGLLTRRALLTTRPSSPTPGRSTMTRQHRRARMARPPKPSSLASKPTDAVLTQLTRRTRPSLTGKKESPTGSATRFARATKTRMGPRQHGQASPTKTIRRGSPRPKRVPTPLRTIGRPATSRNRRMKLRAKRGRTPP